MILTEYKPSRNITKSDAIRSVQSEELRKVAELRRDCASELIRGDVPERATLNGIKNTANESHFSRRWIIRDMPQITIWF